jgi:glycogen synthase
MNVLYLTREYPPHVYGGAGVHIEHLAREMARLETVRVLCFGEQDAPEANPAVKGLPYGDGLFAGADSRARGALAALETNLRMTATEPDADVVHCHTWYSHFAGILARQALGIPLVITVHSLEPLRPWKREQLGRGYDLSCWIERQALEMADGVIAVSKHDHAALLELFDLDPARVSVVPNGIDADVYSPRHDPEVLRGYGVDPDVPYVLFLGRITRQKGIGHFLAAARRLPTDVQVVICAGDADTEELSHEVVTAVDALRAERPHVAWIQEMVPRANAIALYSHAAVFCCPSVYEPFGIINLEAMACETPVVASRVGGIPDVVVPGETGELVPLVARSANDPEPDDPDAFAAGLAEAMTTLLADPERRARQGRAGRQRVIDEFGWDAVARKVQGVYRQAIAHHQEDDA